MKRRELLQPGAIRSPLAAGAWGAEDAIEADYPVVTLMMVVLQALYHGFALGNSTTFTILVAVSPHTKGGAPRLGLMGACCTGAGGSFVCGMVRGSVQGGGPGGARRRVAAGSSGGDTTGT